MAALVTTKDEIVSFFRGDFSWVNVAELIQQPVTKLIGVSEDAASNLKKVGGIETVVDLATSSVFDVARKISAAAVNPSKSIFSAGGVPRDLLAEDSPSVALVDLPSKPLSVLAGVPRAEWERIKKGLNVETVQDLGQWPPYRAVRETIDYIFFPESAADDGEAPKDLLPKSGECPIEKVQYSTLLMGNIPTPVAANVSKTLVVTNFNL